MGIANLLSLPQLERDGFTIKYQTNSDWIITSPQGKEIVLKKDTGRCDRFPYLDVRGYSQGQDDVAMVQTVRENYEGYTKREVEKAIQARKAQMNMGNMSDADFKDMVSKSTSVKNIPVSLVDITNAHALFGPKTLPAVQGNTVRKKPLRVDTEYVEIPRDFYRLHHFVTLTADIMFVNGIPFLVTLSRKIRLVTVEHVPSCTAK